MSDGDVTEAEVVLDGVLFYVEARQDNTEHEVGNKLTEGPAPPWMPSRH